ncbi:hypothetical protein ECDEC7C_5090 [Escherichia coli DEC7C]|nr:hypothetical protein ECTX1999_3649 [Escherichia coli TX1999]EHV83059.1 hypothetical protein ECDEC7C_5090 [Escherichia coli DEC7C]
MFIQHCLRAMNAPPSIKWILSSDTVYVSVQPEPSGQNLTN